MLVPAHLQGDGYKFSHHKQYSPHTEVVYSTWTPRKSRLEGVDKVVFFGLQYFIKDYLIDSFNTTFFNRPKEEVINEFVKVMKAYSGDEDASHWAALHDLGYLPLKITALPEGTLTPIRVPMFTIENTKPEFYWLTNFIETILSTEIWKPMTSATIALQYRKILDKWAEKTCDDNSHVDFQGHDFSLRGMVGLNGGSSSGAGHLLSFKGTDTVPAILWLEAYYNANNSDSSVGVSIPATEHSVAETNIIEIRDMIGDKSEHSELTQFMSGLHWSDVVEWDSRKLAEAIYLNRLLNVYPSGFFSYVADTYNLWEVCSSILPVLKDKIMSRDGRVVIRPDSGDPVDILCGLNTKVADDESCKEFVYGTGDTIKPIDGVFNYDRDHYSQENPRYQMINWDNIEHDLDVKGVNLTRINYSKDAEYNCQLQDLVPEENQEYAEQRYKGVIELLWDVFGGTINSKGYKVLDPHIGCIYGDAITLERAEQICKRLESKGFASSNVVLGIGSYTYNMNTRDTFGFALKTTYGVVNGKELLLYKDPITDDGTKKSALGRVAVIEKDGELQLVDGLYQKDWLGYHLSKTGEKDVMIDVFKDGKLLVDWTLEEIRERIKQQTNVKQPISV